jgi:molybdopterin/thiamine biosynthesis adenylyltransferase
MGCRRFRIADCGAFDASNGNRQTGCSFSTVGRNKAEVVAETVRDVNPAAEVEVFPEGVQEANVERFLREGSVVLDGIDLYALAHKRLLYDRARAAGLPVISTPILGFGAALAVFDPRRSPTFEQHFGVVPDRSDEKAWRRALTRIAMGFFGQLPPLDWPLFARRAFTGRCPSVGAACMLAASLGAAATADCILGRGAYPVVPDTLHVDLQRMRAVRVGALRRLWFKLNLAARLLPLRRQPAVRMQTQSPR